MLIFCAQASLQKAFLSLARGGFCALPEHKTSSLNLFNLFIRHALELKCESNYYNYLSQILIQNKTGNENKRGHQYQYNNIEKVEHAEFDKSFDKPLLINPAHGDK